MPEHSLSFTRELSEKTAVPLPEHAARDKLHAGNPTGSEHRPLGGQNLADAEAGAGKTFEWACRAVVALRKRGSGTRV